MTQIEKITIGDYTFPDWTLVTGKLITSSALVGIIVWIIYAILDALFIDKKVNPINLTITKILNINILENILAYQKFIQARLWGVFA